MEYKPSEHQRDILLDKERILYRLARLARNTDGIHPSSLGPMIGACLLELRLIDGEKYDRECINQGLLYENEYLV